MTTILSGTLVAKKVKDFTPFRIVITYQEKIDVGGDEKELIPARKETKPLAKGIFKAEIPAPEDLGPEIKITALRASGLSAGEKVISRDDPFHEIEIEVKLDTTTSISPSTDLTLGEQIKYRGRAIDPKGTGIDSNLVVVLWARQKGEDKAAPISVSYTASGGYFSGLWPDKSFEEAYAQVAGSDPVPILLEGGFIPFNMVIVISDIPQSDTDEDCDCLNEIPRAPDALDLGINSETFAQDAQRCVDFTTPNRAVEEVTYQAIVRTTQPELKGTLPVLRPTIPPILVDRLADLARLRPTDFKVVESIEPNNAPSFSQTQINQSIQTSSFRNIRSATSAPKTTSSNPKTVINQAVIKAQAFAPGITLDGEYIINSTVSAELANQVLEARIENNEPLKLEPSVLAELVRESVELTPQRLLEAEQTSVVRRFRGAVSLINNANPGRFQLDETHQVDWDEIPESSQATTIAHGHILTLKQVWKADGYSLGDLLYSLPLAPGQQKLISVLDWNREEVASRRSQRVAEEDLTASLSHDRDVSDIIRASLSERMNAKSSSKIRSGGGAFGGFIGPLVFGAAGGVSSASSTASQTSARTVTGLALNKVRDRTLQSASAVRSQRSTVVQSARQGESVRAQTEVVANYNHCHAVTIEYFEVLRHLQVSQELAQVQECLFIPFAITTFSQQKAMRWRDVLRPGLRINRLTSGFDALERVANNWVNSDFPVNRYADEVLRYLDGEFYIRMLLPRPEDDGDDFKSENWALYNELLWDTPENIWNRYLGVALPKDRDAIWDARIAPGIAQRLLNKLTINILRNGFAPVGLDIDPTLVSRFAQNRRLMVSFRAQMPSSSIVRAQIESIQLQFDFGTSPSPDTLPAGAEVRIESGSIKYRTDHLNHQLFSHRRIQNDLSIGDLVEVATPLDKLEKRNPRQRDRRYVRRLLDHLNEHVEYYHRMIWFEMDPNRRYLLLDGFLAPDAGGKSVASVVENRVLGVVGNSLVMPVAPGQKLDSTYEFADATPEDLRHLYASNPVPPMRISMPTSGVFAEAVMGKCNSCEQIDDTKFWRWEDAPIPDQPIGIDSLSTNSRRTTPASLTADSFPESLVRLQTTPSAPDPTGLAAAIKALGVNNVFKDLTGLSLNQQNAAEALKSSIKAGQEFATKAGALAQQKFLNKELDRSIENIKSARDKNLITKDQAQELTESVLRGAIGEPRPGKKSPTKSPEVQRAMERVSNAKKGSLRITRPEGSVEVNTGDNATKSQINVFVEPSVVPIKQPSNMTCWAAGGTMMKSWQAKASFTIQTVLDGLGGDWRGKFDRNEGLSPVETRAFFAALGMTEEGPQSYTPTGLARLLQEKGALLEIGDDGIENNLIVHVRIIMGLKGDGSLEGTKVTLADSASGTIIEETFTQFDKRHGASDAVSSGLGIFHF